jgi:hypothetical protein
MMVYGVVSFVWTARGVCAIDLMHSFPFPFAVSDNDADHLAVQLANEPPHHGADCFADHVADSGWETKRSRYLDAIKKH